MQLALLHNRVLAVLLKIKANLIGQDKHGLICKKSLNLLIRLALNTIFFRAFDYVSENYLSLK